MLLRVFHPRQISRPTTRVNLRRLLSSKSSRTPVVIPEEFSNAILTNWRRNQGDWVQRGEVIADVEGEKTTGEITAPETGFLSITVSAGADVLGQGKKVAEITQEMNTLSGPKASVVKPLRGSYFSWGWLTIQDGDKVAIWDISGKCVVEAGPKRLFLWRKWVESLPQYVVDAKRFIQIVYKDGRIEHVRGPTQIGLDPTIHKSISLQQIITLIANQVIVVYQKGESSIVQRQLIEGPTSYMPAPNEYMQQFRWTGSSGRIGSFTKLETSLRQLIIRADNVRTQDNATLSIQFLVFIQLVDVEKMLGSTHDPIASLQHSFTADILEYSSRFSFQDWRGRAHELNDLETFPQAKKMAHESGFQIHKVVFRGFDADSSISELMENSLKKQTEMKLADEEEVQRQKMLDFKMNSSMEREIQNKLHLKTSTEAQIQLDQMREAEALSAAERSHKQELRHLKEKQDLENEIRRTENQIKLNFYRELHKSMGVDITKLLTISSVPTKQIKIVNSDGDVKPTIKVHVNE